MAVDMFIQIEGIKGESQDAQKTDWIDVLAWSLGASQSGTMHTGGGGGGGKANVQDLSFTKWQDKSSPNLFKFCCSGKHFPKAVLSVRKAGDKQEEYLTITLEDLIISSISTGGSGGEDRLTETVALNFARYKMDYKPQKKDGTLDAAVTAGWNIEKNESFG